MPRPKCKIVSSLSLKTVAHRAAVTKCPECDADFEMDHAAQHATTLILDTVHGKHGSIAVVSECPKCFKKSWLHYEFSWFRDYHDEFAPELKKAANGEYQRRHLRAVHQFADSQCAKCAHLVQVRELATLPYVDCTMGDKIHEVNGKPFYHASFGRNDCAKFKPRS